MYESGGEGAREDAGEGSDRSVRLSVPDMDCASCADKVGSALDRVDGVSSYETRPAAGSVAATYDPERVAEGDVVDAVQGAGYDVVDTGEGSDGTVGGAERDVWRSPRGVRTCIGGVLLTAGLVLGFFVPGANARVATVAGEPLLAADVLFLGSVAVAGGSMVRDGYYSARSLSLDMDLLMSVAMLGALVASLVFGGSLYFEAATLATLFGFAELLETASMDRARDSLRELMDLSPDEATVKRDGGEETVPVGEISVGEVVAVRPGERIPMDGEVVDGESAVNQAPITGESVPVDKTVGDEVYAGSVNEGGYLEVRVTSESGDDTLSRVIGMIEDAESSKTDRERFVERFASYYTPVVVGFALLVAVAGPFVLGMTWSGAVVAGLTLLVIACPCAFVISTPVSVVSGVTSAARNGVLVKGGSHLETMGEVEAVALDKTGTLTRGELTVTDIVPLNDNTEEDVLRCARGLERRSEHPIGDAIVEHADEEGVDGGEGRDVSGFENITGEGVRAELGGTTHYAGNPGMFEDLGFDLSHVHAATDGGVVTTTSRRLCERHDCLDLLSDTVPELQSQGKTVVLVGTDEELEGVIAVADEVRPEARWAVERLKRMGVERTVMLTGDNERTARAIADEVGVDDYRAGLLPEEKVEEVEDLVDEHGCVAMVGDGVNDAPALATASVGVAMGAAGTDTALETADIALMGDDISRLPYLYELSGDANRVIRQNVAASLAVKAVLALGVPFQVVPIWLAVLAGDAGMTVGVTANATRLSGVRAEESDQGE